MALTKVTGQVIKNTTDVTVGVLTVTNTLAVGGTVSIGGTLTYEDVTNVDAVGIITARSNILVGSGITLSPDGDVFFTGIATGNGSGLTALNASNLGSGTVPTARLGSGTASSSTFLRGDSTFATPTTTTINNNASTKFITGTGNANELDCEANLSYNNSIVTFDSSNLTINKSTNPTITVTETAGSKSGQFRSNTTGVLLRSLGNYPLIFDTNQTERLRLDSSGNLLLGTSTSIQKFTIDGGGVSIDNGWNVQWGANASRAYIQGEDANGNNRLLLGTNNTERLRIDSSGNMQLGASATIAGLRYFDVQNSSTAATNHGAIIRLISSNAAGNSTASVDMVKYKDGNFYINNNESSGSTNFNTGGSTSLTISSDGKLFTKRTHASSNTGNHPAVDIDTFSNNGSPQAAMATGIDFSVEGVHKKRLAVTYADSSAGTGDWIFYRDQGNNEGLRITSDGYVKTPAQPYCMVGRGSNQSIPNTTSTKILFDTEAVDRGGDFDISNGRFTAPIAGDYLVALIVQYTQNINQCHAGIWKNNGTLGTAFDSWVNWGDDTRAATITVVLQLAASDYIEGYTYHAQGSNMNLEASRTKMTIRYLG